MHEPLYDLYCQLLQGISTFSLDEFESIVREEALVPRLNALDQACEARGIMELGARADGGVAPLARPPDAVMRALRADVKKRETAALRVKLEDAEKDAAEARERLRAKSNEARAVAYGGFLPRTPLNDAYATEQRRRFLLGCPVSIFQKPVFPVRRTVGPKGHV